jgi:predicted transcriptional regulator
MAQEITLDGQPWKTFPDDTAESVIEAEARAEIAWQLVNELGVPLSEVAHHLGVSASAISKILRRRSFRLVENSS